MFPTENEPERSYLLQMLQNIFPSSFITWYSSHAKRLFPSFRFHTSCVSPVRFHWSSPFCLAVVYSSPEISPSSLQSLQVRGVATWVGRGLGSTFTSRRWVWVQVILILRSTRETNEDAREWKFYTFFIILSLQLTVFLFSLTIMNLKNESNINSFNFSTSPQAIKDAILLAQPHFY